MKCERISLCLPFLSPALQFLMHILWHSAGENRNIFKIGTYQISLPELPPFDLHTIEDSAVPAIYWIVFLYNITQI